MKKVQQDLLSEQDLIKVIGGKKRRRKSSLERNAESAGYMWGRIAGLLIHGASFL
ncbi:hypothetical protein [Lactiplantibacillus plantarum]|uniref:hypothetical protein n=1 Tax=Lactiplantibacillus plantarum TaxID=1590 RepID=UPI000ADD8C60|nr:hypothetical protein [Lactiplantibacillus plantarum]MCG0834592.1 hypothetical protein [Lactiplantibacillus plantarum]MCW6117154.1 hypothetical protein [Lactiplantibacillus plantarum]WKF78311.1 hypothetical protein QY877_11625 [Lactiplantibacillus plantarum]BEI48744.1 hypothetical protein AWA2013_01500 [Lactiplantibacillus plantarum]